MTKEYEPFKPFDGQKIAIVHDSGSSLPEKYRTGYDGLAEVPFKVVSVKDGRITTWTDSPFESDDERSMFLDDLESAQMTTSLPSSGDYAKVYKEIIGQGINEIAVIPMSSGMSGSMNSATQAADMLKGEANISVADVKTVSVGQGLLVTQADIENKAGRFDSAAEVVQRTEELSQNNLYLAQGFSDLAHLRKGGRIGLAASMVGGVFGIIPVLDVNEEGILRPVAKKRGWNKAHNAMIEHIVEGVASHDINGELGNVAVRLALVQFEPVKYQDLRSRVESMIQKEDDSEEGRKSKFKLELNENGEPYETLDCVENMVTAVHSGTGVDGLGVLVIK
jgi:DegV family protein with EDD domain